MRREWINKDIYIFPKIKIYICFGKYEWIHSFEIDYFHVKLLSKQLITRIL